MMLLQNKIKIKIKLIFLQKTAVVSLLFALLEHFILENIGSDHSSSCEQWYTVIDCQTGNEIIPIVMIIV